MFQTNLREVDADLDEERVLDFVQDFGADAWLVNGGGILSFYPTDLPFQTRNPYLAARDGGDLLGDAVAAAHRRGMKLMARMDFSKVSMAIAEQHPEWCFVGPDGEWQVINGQVSVCPSAGYYQERVFDILDEILDRYPVDGFFFNWFGFNEIDYSGSYRGVSQSASSQHGFAKFSGGRPLPTGPESEDYALWQAWSGGVIRDLAARFRAHLHARRPDICLIRSADVTFYEANNQVGRELWHHATGEAVSAFRAHRPGTPVLVNSVAFVDMPYRMAGEQPEHFAQYLIQTIARGGNPSTYIMGAPGEIPYAALDVASEIIRYHRKNTDSYRGLVPAAHLALVRPDRLSQIEGRHETSTAEFRGLYAALQQCHLPFDVVALESVTDMGRTGGLDRYAVLVLPDVGELDSPTIAVLEAFALAGGRLLLTGASGFDSAGHAQLAGMPAERIVDSVTNALDLKSTYMSSRDPEGGRHFFSPVAPVLGAHHRIEVRGTVESGFVFLPPAPYGPPEKAHGHRSDGQPGYVASDSGDGRVVLVPWTVGRSYHEVGLTSLRDFVVRLVRDLLGDAESVSAHLPEHIEITLQQRPGATLVHLINLSGARRKSFGPPVVTRGGILRLRGAADSETPVSATALVAGEPCTTTVDGADVLVHLPDIHRFEAVEIQNAEGEGAQR
ncbi:family 10 glycosylhydrolase [Nakamurella flavida]|uniref:Family 10 glycosylhydrolase n=1 Tax=Nakamurella flavida TaxID=363630 RepID=A0A939C5P5_9ACTN|nr:alpha-amylase family protein [Nakamurella flavida]MBM9476402.1 family 10 glycosylhydrolase [Nakamurella flavida]MDP9779497.1 hypothetical protein [Nakamurella flavida]